MTIPSQEQVSLLTDYDTSSPYTMAYQTLYTSIRLNWDSKQSRQHTLLLATPTVYAGHAAAVANLSIAAAQNGTPTIVVDADIHSPSLQQRFGVGESTGLTDLLLDESITAQTIATRLCKTFVPGLQLLCAGKAPLQDTQLLPFEKLQAVVQGLVELQAATEHVPSLIIFNSTPVLASPDTAQLSSLVEETLLTIITGRTTRTQAKQAQEQLQRVHAKLAGIVMLDI